MSLAPFRAMNTAFCVSGRSSSFLKSVAASMAVSLVNLTREYRVSMVTELDAETLQAAGIERCENPEAFVAAALEETDADEIAVIPYAGQTLPTVKGSQVS